METDKSSERTTTPGSGRDQAGNNAARFLKLARAGAHKGASSGEKVAHRLAKALHQIGDDLALLDFRDIEGAYLVMRRMSGPWATDQDKAMTYGLIDEAVKG